VRVCDPRSDVSVRDMPGATFSGPYSAAIVDAALLALVLVVPALWAGYLRHATRPLSPDFSLRRLEAFELDRAEALYKKISQRLGEIDQLAHAGTGRFWQRIRHRAQIREQYREEIEDLKACNYHLRTSIMGLRRRPIQRLRSWVHVISCRFAFSGSLAAYLIIAVPASVFIYVSEQPLWVQELVTELQSSLPWKPFDERLLYANGITSGLVVLLAPILYALRRARLYSDHRTQAKVLQDFAFANLDRLANDDAPNTGYVEDPAIVGFDGSSRWFAVLELSPSASVDEVREAYRTKVKQTHPDRVNGMAPAFKNLAEAETKKLNAAYQEALAAARVG
jgi:hypothetical protein